MSQDLTLNPEGYTYPEKLAMVSQGLMAPEAVGVSSAEEATQLQVMDAPTKTPFLGDFCTFEVSEVPQKLRALWAKQDRKVIEAGDDFEEKWLAENKETHLLQARLRCGNVATMLEQTVTDVVGGFAVMLENAAGVLRQMKERFDKGDFAPPERKDPLLERKGAIDVPSEIVRG